ncbi:MAG: molybdenum cofactor biosynthesis protein MoaE [Deltaproteobacteria bacterium]|nr:MAG: molybdenum cofactor biosynthesis protein MoaE [Deltaproteobacteria bacterium]
MIALTQDKIETWKILQSLHNVKAGGHVHFVGTIRDDQGILGLRYDCYETMALSEIKKIVEEAKRRWPVIEASVVHRIGWVPVGEEAVVVAVACAHRKEAFEACEYIIDTLKHEVPIWKMGEGAQECCAHTTSSPVLADITGVILAGGKSSRFGTNKALVPWKQHTFIEEVLHTMQSVFDRVVIVTNTPEVYQHLGVEMLKDAIPHQGPLGGIEVALRECGSSFVVACDMPLVTSEEIKSILSKRSQKSEAVIAFTR